MVRRIYAVYDKLAKDIMTQLLMFPNDTVASRSFVDMVNTPNTAVNQHPEDYSLIYIGSLVQQLREDDGEPTGFLNLFPPTGGEFQVVLTGTQVKAVSDSYAGVDGMSEEARRQLSLQV